MNRSKITLALIGVSFLAIILDIARGDIWSKVSLIYLIWNLFLAWIPYIISFFFIKKEMKMKQFIPLFIIWLLFFPNAPYLVTDVLHIATRTAFPLWYDSLLFFFFGWIGLYLGMISLSHINEYLRNHFKFWISELFIFMICLISSFGVYLGRFQRWNSWDLFTNPLRVASDINGIFFNLSHGFNVFIFVSIFTLFTYSIYKLIYFSRLNL